MVRRGLDLVLFVAWGIAGVAALLLWAMAGLPAEAWLLLIRRNAASLVAGPALGVAAHLLGLLAQNQWRPLARAHLAAR